MSADDAPGLEEAVAQSPEDLETAIEIAHQLADQAVWSGDLCAFHGATAPESIGQPAIYRSFGGDLYEGSAGVARFLGLMARVTGDAGLRRAALGALAHAMARGEGWSLFAGRAGAGLVALEVARWLDQPALVPAGLEAIELASEAALDAAEHAPLDLIAGTAGVVHTLAEAIDYDLDGGWCQRAARLGHALIEGARRTETGWSWPMMPAQPDHLCGLGHGAAGIALAFTELSSLMPHEPGWRAAAEQARAFERQWHSPEHGSWADLRSDPSVQPRAGLAYPHFWCHGSVGIGHDRIAATAAGLADTATRADAIAALAGARAAAERILSGPAGPGAGFEANGSQCHGVGGMIDLFVEAWQLDPDPTLLTLSRSLTAFMRNDAGQARRWRCGVLGGTTSPGLMLGLAGIGWAHLRAWSPSVVPTAWTPRLGSVPLIPPGR